MLNSLFIQRTPAEIEKLETFIDGIVAPKTQKQQEQQASLYELKTDSARIDLIWDIARQAELGLTKPQCKAIYEAKTTKVQEIEEQVLKLDGKKLDPKAKLALQTTLMLAAIYLTPELFAFYTGKEMLKKVLSLFVSENKLKFADLGVTIGSQTLGYHKNLNSLIDQSIPENIAHLNIFLRFLAVYPTAGYLLDNAMQPIQAVATLPMDKEFNERAGDFFDIMHGQADDDTIAKYKGSWATKPIDELGADIVSGVGSGLSWMWNAASAVKARLTNQAATTTVATAPRLN